MKYADIGTSPRRNWRFLTSRQQATFAPCRSEQAVSEIASRMGVRMPGSRT